MKTIWVSDIQHFSVGDGPGIRTTVFLKGCCLRCPWCHNPETISRERVTLVYPRAHRAITYGRTMTTAQVAEEVLEDVEFYRESGGGVTISGGEPLLQAEAAAELADLLRNKGVSVLLDTAGCVAWSRFETILPFVDIVYFDWKTSDPVLMREQLGGDLSLIKENLTRLLRVAKETRVRIPLIPGVNTSEETLVAMGEDLRRMGAKTLSLLPFHRLATGKYEAMGLSYPYRDTPPLSPHVLKRAEELLSRDFTVHLEK